MSTSISDFREAEGDLYAASDADTTDVDDSEYQNTDEGFWDYAAGSFDEAVARQFDDRQGDGYVDEMGNVLDPTSAGSESTESDIREAALWTNLLGSRDLLLASDTSDILTGNNPPDGAYFQQDDIPDPANMADQIVQALLEALRSIPWMMIGAGVALFAMLLVAVNAFAGGVAEGVTQ